MIAEDLSLELTFTSWSLMETTSKCIDHTWLKEDGSPLVYLSDGFQQFLVGRKQVLVVGLARNKGISWVSVEIRPNWLVQELIAYQVGLHGHIGRHHFPELAEMVQETTLVAEQIFLQFHKVIGGVEGSEFYLEAVLSQRKALVVIPQLYRQRGRKGFPFRHPQRQSLPAELLSEEILMCIEDDRNSKFMTFPDNVPQGLSIGIVIDSSFRLQSLPSSMQPK